MCSFPNRDDQGWETKAHGSHMQHLWRALSPNVLCIQWSGGTFQSCVIEDTQALNACGRLWRNLFGATWGGNEHRPWVKAYLKPQVLQPKLLRARSSFCTHIAQPTPRGQSSLGNEAYREPSQPEPQKQGTSKFTGSGRVFSSDTGRRTWEVRAQQNWGFGDDRLSRRRLRHGLGVGLLASLSWGVACHRPRSTIQPRSSQHVMNCNILTRTHRFQSCNQYTSPLAADVINDANTYFLINLPY